MQYCKRGYFRWGEISRKCWQDISRGGHFHDSTRISFIKKYGSYFCVGVIFAKKTKTRKLPPRQNVHVYIIVCGTWYSKPFQHCIVICRTAGRCALHHRGPDQEDSKGRFYRHDNYTEPNSCQGRGQKNQGQYWYDYYTEPNSRQGRGQKNQGQYWYDHYTEPISRQGRGQKNQGQYWYGHFTEPSWHWYRKGAKKIKVSIDKITTLNLTLAKEGGKKIKVSTCIHMITTLNLTLAKEGGKKIKVIIDMITTLNLTLAKERGKKSRSVSTWSQHWT